MLDHVWLVPVIPAVAFLVILFFGKRLPKQGAEVGILSVGALFVIAIAAAEVGVGLAIVLLIYRNKVDVNVDEIDLMKG